jgi:hypothetical protein
VASVLADTACVAGFVLLGRFSHREGGAVTGYLAVLWPFLVGLAAGWVALSVAARVARREPAPETLRAGLVVLVATVGVGMAVRRTLTDGGTPVSFVVVATVFLALFLLGRRVVGSRVAARRGRGGGAA